MDLPHPYSDCKDIASVFIVYEVEMQKTRQQHEEDMRNSMRIRQEARDRQFRACVASIIYPQFIHYTDSF
jgi:hypothetical protein